MAYTVEFNFPYWEITIEDSSGELLVKILMQNQGSAFDPDALAGAIKTAITGFTGVIGSSGNVKHSDATVAW